MTRVRIYQGTSQIKWPALEAFRQLARELGDDVVSFKLHYKSIDQDKRGQDRKKESGDDLQERIGSTGQSQA